MLPGILKLNLLATDYYHDDAYPSYLFYNPYYADKTVIVNFSENQSDIYDAVSNQVIITNTSGNTSITIPADGVIIAVLIPAGSTISYDLNKASVDGMVIDYNSGNPVANYPPRIKAVAALDTLVTINSNVNLFCAATDRETADLTYSWETSGVIVGSGSSITVISPAAPATIVYKCTVTDGGGLQAIDSTSVSVVEIINYPPEIHIIYRHRQIPGAGKYRYYSLQGFRPEWRSPFF